MDEVHAAGAGRVGSSSLVGRHPERRRLERLQDEISLQVLKVEGGMLVAAGVPLRDVQEAASHADPRTTMRNDRGRQSLSQRLISTSGARDAISARNRSNRHHGEDEDRDDH